MRPSVLLLYKCLFSIKQRQRTKGFTLIELLISLIIASMVVAGLLYGVVELTSIDRRESIVDQVQRDMNRAMEYMTDDLKEAVYVYADPQPIATQLAADSVFPDDAGEVPILAFWRIDPIEENLPDCTSVASALVADCQLLEIRQAAYTLVVYAQKANDGNSNWPGQSRIVRYELSRYSDLATLTDKSGYRDPTDPEDEFAAFGSWQSQGIPDGVSAVLADYVQAPTFPVPVTLDRAPLSDVDGPCSGYGNDANGNQLYSVVPTNATVDLNNTFFACVRNPVLDTGSSGNQDVYLFLRGNVQGVQGGVRSFSDETSLPIIERQVLVRGIVNKGFRQ